MIKAKLFKLATLLLGIFIIPFLYGYGSPNYVKEFISVFKENARNGSAEVIGLIDDLQEDFQSFPNYFSDFETDGNILETIKNIGKVIVGISKLVYEIISTPIQILIVVFKYASGFITWYLRLFRGVK